MTERVEASLSSSLAVPPRPAGGDAARREFGALIKAARLSRGIPQKVVAFDVGITPPYLRRLEKGGVLPETTILVSLAGYFDIPLSVLATVAGAFVDAKKLTPAQQIAEYLFTELQKLVSELDMASDELKGNKKLRALLESARGRATSFLIVVRRARGHALRKRRQA
jgi:transcriptional regulator with XRE-family HTH domain